MRRKAVIVLGTHRSGTSVLTAGLKALGVKVYNKAMPANSENPKGFFEDEEIVHFNDRLMRFLNTKWDNPLFDCRNVIADKDIDSHLAPWYNEAKEILIKNFGSEVLWGVKDPRMCQLLPFWKRVFSQPEFSDTDFYYIHVIRNPLEVALSLQKRHYLNPDYYIGENIAEGLALWFFSHYQSIREVYNSNNIAVLFSDLLNDPHKLLERIANFLKIDYSLTIADGFANDFVDSDLVHYKRQNGIEEPIEEKYSIVDYLYNSLRELSKLDCFSKEDTQKVLDFLIGTEKNFNLVSPLASVLSKNWYNWHEVLGQKSALQKEHSSLRETHSVLKEKHSDLQNEHAVQKNNLTSLQENHSALEQQHSILQNEHASLQGQYSMLKEQYTKLQINEKSTKDLQNKFDCFKVEKEKEAYEKEQKIESLSDELAGIYTSLFWEKTRPIRKKLKFKVYEK